MDKLSGIASKLGGNKQGSQTQPSNNANTGQEDYVDKGAYYSFSLSFCSA